ncbi:MAG TPA: hypothetical protein VGH74_14435, partial [Planctomycetaceae bacterium]
ILEPLYAEMAQHDPAGVLRNEWLNARGAIARFSRNTIEIRVLDVQECPQADLAICAAVVALLQALVSERWTSLARQQEAAVDPLAAVLLTSIRNAEEAVILDREYLEQFGFPGESCTAGELWDHLIAALPELGGLFSPWRESLAVIRDEGPLARRIVSALESNELYDVYGELCRCLQEGEMFRAE